MNLKAMLSPAAATGGAFHSAFLKHPLVAPPSLLWAVVAPPIPCCAEFWNFRITGSDEVRGKTPNINFLFMQ